MSPSSLPTADFSDELSMRAHLKFWRRLEVFGWFHGSPGFWKNMHVLCASLHHLSSLLMFIISWFAVSNILLSGVILTWLAFYNGNFTSAPVLRFTYFSFVNLVWWSSCSSLWSGSIGMVTRCCSRSLEIQISSLVSISPLPPSFFVTRSTKLRLLLGTII